MGRLHLTPAHTQLLTKAEPEVKPKAVSPGWGSIPPCPPRWCPRDPGPTLRVEHSMSASSRARCRDSTVALRSSSVSLRVSMMPWLSRFSLSGAGEEDIHLSA